MMNKLSKKISYFEYRLNVILVGEIVDGLSTLVSGAITDKFGLVPRFLQRKISWHDLATMISLATFRTGIKTVHMKIKEKYLCRPIFFSFDSLIVYFFLLSSPILELESWKLS